MAKYMILCSTSRSYHLVVEAPTEEAAERYYERCDGDEFIAGEPGGWQLDEIYEDDTRDDADVAVDEWGEPLDKLPSGARRQVGGTVRLGRAGSEEA